MTDCNENEHEKKSFDDSVKENADNVKENAQTQNVNNENFNDTECSSNEETNDTIKENTEEVEMKNAKENGEKNESKENNEKPKDELEIAKEKIKELEDKYKRLLAEFDNFRKRSEKENLMMSDFGTMNALNKILPIVDNLERAIKNIPEDLKNNPFVEGVDKTYKQVLKTFEDLQIKPIEAVGKPFDANIHNAVMTDETSEAETDTVTEELQKGYMYKDQVLRHSMVKVKK